jgi:hypothetical protein
MPTSGFKDAYKWFQGYETKGENVNIKIKGNASQAFGSAVAIVAKFVAARIGGVTSIMQDDLGCAHGRW